MRHRLTILPVLIALLCPPVAAQAMPAHKSKPKKPTAQSAQRDCANDGDLDKKYTLAVLKSAIKTLPADIAQYTACPGALNSQKAMYTGSKGRATVAAIKKDCNADADLDHRYTKSALKQARKKHACAGPVISQLSYYAR